MTGKSDAEKLMGELFGFANKMLEKYGEFNPFGGYLNNFHEVVHVGIDSESATENLENIEIYFRKIAAEGLAKVCGIARNVELTLDACHKIDAIQIFLEHQDGYCADVFFHYELNGGVKILETTAQQGEPKIFALSH